MSLTQSLELTTACNPWMISAQGTTVTGSGSTAPVLTVDQGVTVAVAAGGFFWSAPPGSPATLVVNGSQTKPVSFTAARGSQMPGSWAGVQLGDAAGGSSLTYTTISYGSGSTLAKYPGALVVFGGTSTNLVTLNNITVNHNGGCGFNFAGIAAIAGGSGNLTVSDWGASSYPIVIDANEVGSLPTSLTFGTGSGTPVIALDCQDTNACGNPMTIDHTQTWPALLVPYQVLLPAGINVDAAMSPIVSTPPAES